MYRVLLVDDEQIERMALAKKIDRYYGDKVNIYQAVNGREAVAMCSEQKNDIIIMDISMPEMNGVMAAKYIRQMDDKCSIVFLSAYDDFEYARNAIKVKALDYLLKPCDINDLLAVMDMAIQKLDKENAVKENTATDGKGNIFKENARSGKENVKDTDIYADNNNIRDNRHKRMIDNLRNSDEQTTVKYLKEYVENNYIYDITMQEAAEEIEEELGIFEEVFEKLRISTLLIGPYDADNAIVTLHAGAGGTEAMDWTSMLYRMYSRWAEKRGYEVEVLDYLEGDVAGIKGVTFEVKGENAYGYLRSEKGVHRLVRISPFNANGKRQTSFASCDVIPDIEEDIDIEINDDDIRVDTYRSSGAGGQHINKTSSAIRITHLPTGIVVQCQNERSQHMNKDKAMQMLKSKLYVLKQQEQAEKMSDIRGEVRDINFGNQIRSYVMQPYTLVKDHRTNAEISNVGAVMDGNIDPFINAYLSMDAEAQKGKKAE